MAQPEASGGSAFVRLWLGFATARVGLAVALLLLLLLVRLLGTPTISGWVLGMCGTYLASTLAVRLLMKPASPGHTFDPQWVSSIGVDLLVFSTLQLLQPAAIYFAPLFAVPVLMAAVLGSTLLALGTAAAVALLLLADAWIAALQVPQDFGPRFLQAGLTGFGYFALAVLAHQLSIRLAREEEAARQGRRAAVMQAQVNRLVIEALAEGVLVVDTAGELQAANPAARELLGPAAHGGVTLRLASQPAWQPLADMAQRTFATREPQAADLGLADERGAPRRMLARTRLAEIDRDGGDGLCVVFLQDLREMEAQLRTEKLAAMGRMSTAVAHEIRNPLAAISQANELLEEELREPLQRQLSALVRQNAQRLAQIVEDILDVARVQHQEPGPGPLALALDPVVRGSCEDWAAQNRCGEQVQLRLQAPGTHVAFEADHLRRIVVNLMDNALRYCSEAPDAIQVATHADDGVVLTVWSDGPALEPAVERHLFEPFFSSESRSSGLGLFICRELCERHGARIGYRRGPAPAAAGGRDGNAFFVAFRTARPLGTAAPFAKMAA
ncbi:MAG TPA: ATP-binding protein [Ramlibacter sp.]|nr:ATP-binding protein [Ramlibacter sp.]